MYRVCSVATRAYLSVNTVMSLSEQVQEREHLEINSFMRGYHVYMNIWDAVISEKLKLVREPTNLQDQTAVAVKKDQQIVVHITKRLSSTVFHFLSRPCNSGCVEVTGSKINRGARYSLELPCVYHFHGPVRYLTRLKKLLDRLKEYI